MTASANVAVRRCVYDRLTFHCFVNNDYATIIGELSKNIVKGCYYI